MKWLSAWCVATVMSMAAAQSPPAANNGGVPVVQEMRAGTSLDSALATLNARGFRIVYSTALVTPAMKLRAAPRAKTFAALLQEILAPWQLRAVPAANGDWLIVAAPVESRTSSTKDLQDDEVGELQTVDVTASRYGLATTDHSAVFLDRRGVEQMPHLADDAVRMLKVLPGVSGGDFSAALNIRGGRREETLLRIDGAEIHNGFHFRDLDGALSVLDTNLVESIDFVTGGMTVRDADYMSGVVNLRTRRPREADEFRSAAGISFVSAYGRTGGTFSEGRGAWLASARRGYLDVLMERVQDDDEQLTPRYTDVFVSLFYDFSEDTAVAAHALLGNDDLRLISRDEDDDVDSAGKGKSAHAWITLEQKAGDSLESTTLLSTATETQTRDSSGEDEQRLGDVLADFRFRFHDLRSDWSWKLDERHMLLFGANANRSEAEYDYALNGYLKIPTAPNGQLDIGHTHLLDLSGSKLGAHAAWRARAGKNLVVEAGLRWDQYRYPQGLRFSVVSPRLNTVLDLGEHGEVRAAYGVQYQPQGLHELQLEDNVTRFFEPERANQAVLGYTYRFATDWSARIDVYHKDYSRLRPRFENALDPVQLIPEGAVDRVRIDAADAEARGVEITLRREAERGFAGWASLALATVEEDVAGEGWTPRLWDQEYGVSFGISWVGAKWNVNVAGLYHGGTPTTRLGYGVVTTPTGEDIGVIVAGPRNGDRVGDYARIDLRASRAVQMRGGKFSFYLEVTNLLNRENPCCVQAYHLESDAGRTWLYQEQGNWLPMLPSFGFQFEF